MIVMIELEPMASSVEEAIERFDRLGLSADGGLLECNGEHFAVRVLRDDAEIPDEVKGCHPLCRDKKMVAFYHGPDCNMSQCIAEDLATGHDSALSYCNRRIAGGVFETIELSEPYAEERRAVDTAALKAAIDPDAEPPQSPCPDCAAVFDDRHIKHEQTCPMMGGVEQACERDREFFDTHPFAERYNRELTPAERLDFSYHTGQKIGPQINRVEVRQVSPGVRMRLPWGMVDGRREYPTREWLGLDIGHQ